MRFMIDGGDSGGGFSLVEHPMAPPALAAPLHRHTHEDEYNQVVEGRVGALLCHCPRGLKIRSPGPPVAATTPPGGGRRRRDPRGSDPRS